MALTIEPEQPKKCRSNKMKERRERKTGRHDEKVEEKNKEIRK